MAITAKNVYAAMRYATIGICLLTSGLPALSVAETIPITAGQVRLFMPVHSFKELRDEGVVKQQYDYSCGAAALATLLTYGLGDAVTEQYVLDRILTTLAHDAEALLKKQGLSLLDMQRVAQERGHKAQGFRLDPAYLAKLQRPVIVFIKPQGYKHFAVLKGVQDERVYLADPSLGNWRMPLYKFLDMWLDTNGKGVVFVVERQDVPPVDGPLLRLPTEQGLRPEVLSARQMLQIVSHGPLLKR